MLAQIFILQFFVLCVIVLVLVKLLERDLVLAAIERLEGLRPCGGTMKEGVQVLVAGELPPVLEARLRDVLRDKFPGASVDVLLYRKIRAGVVIRAGDVLMDYSLADRLRRLWGYQE